MFLLVFVDIFLVILWFSVFLQWCPWYQLYNIFNKINAVFYPVAITPDLAILCNLVPITVCRLFEVYSIYGRHTLLLLKCPDQLAVPFFLVSCHAFRQLNYSKAMFLVIYIWDFCSIPDSGECSSFGVLGTHREFFFTALWFTSIYWVFLW